MKAEIKDELIQFKLKNSTKILFIVLILIGVASFFAGFTLSNHSRHHGEHSNPAWSAFLVGTYLTLGVSIASILFTAIGHITGSHWLVTIRRIAESYSKFLPLGLLFLAILLFFGTHELYEWSHKSEKVLNDHLIQHKSAWLNEPFFIGRLIVIGLVWIVFGFFFYKNSTNQDADKEVIHTQKNSKLSAIFILIFALSFSIFSFDLLMSLTPHWFSTMWAVYCFAGIYQATLSSFALMIFYIKKNGYLGDLVNENHIHDVGKFMLSFCVFWAYVGFSQFMLIWYANLPEETFWYEQRLTGGWSFITISLPFIKFILPFLLLLNRPNKRDINFLSKVALWIIFVEIVELYWIVFPSNFEHFDPAGFGITLGVCLGFIGLFGFIVLKGLEANKLIPVGDPRLEKSLQHHQ
jgi:MFS family permease